MNKRLLVTLFGLLALTRTLAAQPWVLPRKLGGVVTETFETSDSKNFASGNTDEILETTTAKEVNIGSENVINVEFDSDREHDFELDVVVERDITNVGVGVERQSGMDVTVDAEVDVNVEADVDVAIENQADSEIEVD